METKELITNAIRYIRENPKENLSLQSIADNAGFSLTYFDALFKQHTGYTPVEYSRVYKLTRAAIALRCTDDSVLDISLEYGYQSPESFSRAFKAFYSLTPSEYREKYADSAITWTDLSARIAVSRFAKTFPTLRRTNDSVLDIALEYGYQSPESFSRAFKEFYSLSPSEYREKYADSAITWTDLSARIAVSRFAKTFPTLRRVQTEEAIDWLFTHDPVKYAEDLVGVTVGDVAVFTLDNGDLTSFVYASDYDDEEPSVDLVCEDEEAALAYLRLFVGGGIEDFSMRVAPGTVWERFDAAVAAAGMVCRTGHDMILRDAAPCEVDSGEYEVRELTADDLPALAAFRDAGGCGPQHVRAVEIAFAGKGNVGTRPVGVFDGGALVCFALPTADRIRDLVKYDIGGMFTLGAKDDARLCELAWRYAASLCATENAFLGNANAKDDDSPLGAAFSRKMGLVEVAEERRYVGQA